MTTTTKPVRAYATDLHITVLGTMDLNVDAVPARRSAPKVALTTIHPHKDDPTKLPQVYWDEESGEHFVLGEMDRAREVDGVLYRVTEEEIEALKTPILPPGETSVIPYNATDVEEVTRPDSSVYWLKPRKGKNKKVIDAQARTYAVMVEVLQDTDKAWVMEMSMRNEQKMFRLGSWQGRLFLQELVRPGEFNEIEATEYNYSDVLFDMVKQAADAQTGEFNPDEFTNFYRDRAAALDEAKRNGTDVEVAVSESSVVDDTDDEAGLMAMLAASVKEAKAS